MSQIEKQFPCRFFIEIQSDVDISDGSLRIENRSNLDESTLGLASADAVLKWYNSTKGLKDTFLNVASIVEIYEINDVGSGAASSSTLSSPSPCVSVHIDELFTWRTINPRKTIADAVHVVLNGCDNEDDEDDDHGGAAAKKSGKLLIIAERDHPRKPLTAIIMIIIQLIDKMIEDANRYAIVKESVLRILRACAKEQQDDAAQKERFDKEIADFTQAKPPPIGTLSPTCNFLSQISLTTLLRLQHGEEEDEKKHPHRQFVVQKKRKGKTTPCRKWATNAQIVDFDFDALISEIRLDVSDLIERVNQNLSV